MTKPSAAAAGDGEPAGEGRSARCAWCGRPFSRSEGPGRPRRYCRRSCRQRDFEARRRAEAEGRTDGELAQSRKALDNLDDLLYILACAVEDVQRDLAGDHDDVDVRRSLEWLLDAALPLTRRSQGSVTVT